MTNMNDDEFAELDTTEAEFDAMWERSTLTQVLAGNRTIRNEYGTMHIIVGGVGAAAGLSRVGTRLSVTSQRNEAVVTP